MFEDLAGQVAVVTGGARGLGLSMGRALARHGVRVGLVDLLDDVDAKRPMTAREGYDAMIRDAVWSPLREHGFKRAKGIFRRRNEVSWEVMSFQASQASERERVRFTVNLGVELDVLRAGWRDDKPPTEPNCQLSTRIGLLLTDRVPYDWWWIADSDTDFERLGADLVAALVDHGLPWLEARATPERVRDRWLAELDVLEEGPMKHLVPLVAAVGPPSAQVAVEAELARRATPDGRSVLYRAWGEHERQLARPDVFPPEIYTPRG